MTWAPNAVIDNCTRADENPAVGWETDPDTLANTPWVISSNRLAPSAAFAWKASTGSFGPNVCIGLTLATLPESGTSIELGVRFNDVGTSVYDYYACHFYFDNTMRIGKYVNGVFSWLIPASVQAVGVPSGATYWGSAIGSSVSMGFTSTSTGINKVVSVDDTSIVGAGRMSLYTNGSSVRISNVSGGTVDSSFRLVRRANVT